MGLWDGLLLGVYMVGAGGLPTIIVAWLGRKKAVEAVKPETVEVNSPWLVQNLLEIKITVEGVKGSVDALTATQHAIAIQVNAMSAQLRRLQK
jgi:hypothetical protein